MSSVQGAFSASKDIEKGLAILCQEQWLKLYAFTDEAIYFKPTTEELIRVALGAQGIEASDPLIPEFKPTIEKFARLKGYCELFEKEIDPGMRDLADSVSLYVNKSLPTFDLLIAAVKAFNSNAPTLQAALAALSREWQSARPSKEAAVAKGDFVKYVKILKKDAETRASAAEVLHRKIETFHNNLKASNAEFVPELANYRKLFGALSPEVMKLKAELSAIQRQLDELRKHEDGLVITLQTAPVYLLIPWFGYLVMAGVLATTGTALGALRITIGNKVIEAQKIAEKLGPKEKFMTLYEYGVTSTGEVVKQLAEVLPLVKALKDAWRSLTNNLTELDRNLLAEASANALTGQWDIVNVNLEAARTTWIDLKEKVAKYIECQPERARTVDELIPEPKAA